jgi:hypothetical protein
MRDNHASTAVLERTRHAPPAASANPAPGAQLQDGTPLTEVAPLNYAQLRLLAECAAGAVTPQGRTGAPVPFYFRKVQTPSGSPVDQIELLRQGNAELEPTDILVPTRDEGRFPLNAVSLEIDASTTPGGYPLSEVGIADAVFWSDAAVQKFVFPYVTSCGGEEAASVLARLQHAWNFFPDSVVVYALIHLASSEPGQRLEMDRAFWVAFRYTHPTPDQRVGLHAVSLADFMKIIGEGRSEPGTTSPALVPFQRGGEGPTAPHPRYGSLRAMAEWAAAANDGAVYFVFPASGSGGFKVYTQSEFEHLTLDPADVVVPAFTPTVPAGRPRLESVWLWPENVDAAGNLGTRGDALFWSTASIEQFIFPYYASKGGMNLETLQDLAIMNEMWKNGVTPAGESIYALIHLPHSEWTDVIVEGGEVKTGEPQGDPGTSAEGAEAAWAGGAVKKGRRDEKREIRRLEPNRQLAVVYLDAHNRPRTRSVARVMGERDR